VDKLPVSKKPELVIQKRGVAWGRLAHGPFFYWFRNQARFGRFDFADGRVSSNTDYRGSTAAV
jgi:hypothetical protein